LVEAFAAHTELEDSHLERLRRWVSSNAKYWVAHKYDKAEMRDLITSKLMPRELLGDMPAALFEGRLIGNRFLTICEGIVNMPPRLPMLLALGAQKTTWLETDIIYQAQDYPFNLFLVLSGTFAYVAQPTAQGGYSYVPKSAVAPKAAFTHAPKLTAMSKVRGAFGGGDLPESGPMVRHHSPPSDAPPPDAHSSPSMHPFVWFGFGAYFGEEELFEVVPRKATSRCESMGGELLTITKQELRQLADEFPQFGMRWKRMAVARSKRHRQRKVQLTRGRSVRTAAAVILQMWARSWLRPPRRVEEAEEDEQRTAPVAKRRLCKRMLTVVAQGQEKATATTKFGYVFDKQTEMAKQIEGLSAAVEQINSKLDRLLQSRAEAS